MENMTETNPNSESTSKVNQLLVASSVILCLALIANGRFPKPIQNLFLFPWIIWDKNHSLWRYMNWSPRRCFIISLIPGTVSVVGLWKISTAFTDTMIYLYEEVLNKEDKLLAKVKKEETVLLFKTIAQLEANRLLFETKAKETRLLILTLAKLNKDQLFSKVDTEEKRLLFEMIEKLEGDELLFQTKAKEIAVLIQKIVDQNRLLFEKIAMEIQASKAKEDEFDENEFDENSNKKRKKPKGQNLKIVDENEKIESRTSNPFKKLWNFIQRGGALKERLWRELYMSDAELIDENSLASSKRKGSSLRNRIVASQKFQSVRNWLKTKSQKVKQSFQFQFQKRDGFKGKFSKNEILAKERKEARQRRIKTLFLKIGMLLALLRLVFGGPSLSRRFPESSLELLFSQSAKPAIERRLVGVQTPSQVLEVISKEESIQLAEKRLADEMQTMPVQIGNVGSSRLSLPNSKTEAKVQNSELRSEVVEGQNLETLTNQRANPKTVASSSETTQPESKTKSSIYERALQKRKKSRVNSLANIKNPKEFENAPEISQGFARKASEGIRIPIPNSNSKKNY